MVGKTKVKHESRSDTAICCITVTMNLLSFIPLGWIDAARMIESPMRDEIRIINKYVTHKNRPPDVRNGINGIWKIFII